MNKVAVKKAERSAAYKALKAEYDRYREYNSADLRELNELRREVWNLRKEQREHARLSESALYAENIKLLAELDKVRGALEQIAYTPEFKSQAQIEAFVVQVLEGDTLLRKVEG